MFNLSGSGRKGGGGVGGELFLPSNSTLPRLAALTSATSARQQQAFGAGGAAVSAPTTSPSLSVVPTSVATSLALARLRILHHPGNNHTSSSRVVSPLRSDVFLTSAVDQIERQNLALRIALLTAASEESHRQRHQAQLMTMNSESLGNSSRGVQTRSSIPAQLLHGLVQCRSPSSNSAASVPTSSSRIASCCSAIPMSPSQPTPSLPPALVASTTHQQQHHRENNNKKKKPEDLPSPRHDYGRLTSERRQLALFSQGSKDASTMKPEQVMCTLKALGTTLRSKSDPYIDTSALPDPGTPNVPRGGVEELFPDKLHRMLRESEERGESGVVSWLPHGRCFRVHKMDKFLKDIMPRYFSGQAKWGSFSRQLQLYGFMRMTSGVDVGSYYHEVCLLGGLRRQMFASLLIVVVVTHHTQTL